MRACIVQLVAILHTLSSRIRGYLILNVFAFVLRRSRIMNFDVANINGPVH
jgi:hypothetical protein